MISPSSIDTGGKTAPISAVIATKDRAGRLLRTLESLAQQSVVPDQVVIVDGSKDIFSESPGFNLVPAMFRQVVCERAAQVGAAPQRNQGVGLAGLEFILFCDDDVDFQPECVARLWQALQDDPGLGGVNAMIENQRYQSPGRISRALFELIHGRREESFAGRVIGPGVNLLPEDRDDLPAVVAVEWLNTTCTLYRRAALPSPVFDSFFSDYSLMEDLALALRVGKKWRLANVRTARIHHDSQEGAHKSDAAELARMELVNRHHVMTQVMGQGGLGDYLRLALWEGFQIASTAMGSQSRGKLAQVLRGKWNGLRQIARSRT